MSDQKVRKFSLSGVQNVEAEVSKIIKEEEYMRLVDVALDGNNLLLTFEEDMRKKSSSYVKQVSKKKHSSVDGFIGKNYKEYGNLISLINLPKMWLLFFNK